MNKKAFSTQQLFMIITSVLIIGLVLYLGVRAAGTFTDQTCDIQYAQQTQAIEKIIRDYSSDFGSRTTHRVDLPCSVQTVCFADGTIPVASAGRNATAQALQAQSNSVIAADAYRQGESNVFFLEDGFIVVSDNLPTLSIANTEQHPDGVLCVTGRSARLGVEGVGRQAQIRLLPLQ